MTCFRVQHTIPCPLVPYLMAIDWEGTQLVLSLATNNADAVHVEKSVVRIVS